MSKEHQIVAQIRAFYPDQCVEKIYGMTCSLESSVAEFAAQFPDEPIGTIVFEWFAAAGEPEGLQEEEAGK